MRQSHFFLDAILKFMSLRASAHTGVALSKDSLRIQSPGSSENYRRGVKAPLADQGELSRASPASTRLRGSELPSFCVLSLTQFYNPSVKNQRFLPAPFTQGSRGCSRTSDVVQRFSDNMRGTEISKESGRPVAAPTRYFGDFTIFHHSRFHQLKAWAAPIASTILAARAQAAANSGHCAKAPAHRAAASS